MHQPDPARATERGLDFLEGFALGEACWAGHAPDAQYLLYHLGTRPAPSALTRRAMRGATEAARRWCRENPRLPRDAAPTDLLWWYAYGTYTPTRLGMDTRAMLSDLARGLPRVPTRDLLWFDPSREPPPGNLYEACDCGLDDRRGPRCASCGGLRERLGRYETWMTALIGTHVADALGLDVGCHVADAVRWRAALLPYPGTRPMSVVADRAFYAVTHLVYALDDYSAWRLPTAPFEAELAFVRRACRWALRHGDVEMLGEAVDVMLALDVPEGDALVVAARAALLDAQNPDGSWGAAEDDVYSRFHKTWVALDGLTSYGRRRVARLPRAVVTALRSSRSGR